MNLMTAYLINSSNVRKPSIANGLIIKAIANEYCSKFIRTV